MSLTNSTTALDIPTIDTSAKIFSNCHRTLGSETWGRVLAAMDAKATPASIPQTLEALISTMRLPGYIADLARLEWMLFEKSRRDEKPARPNQSVVANPTVSLLPVGWTHLTQLIRPGATNATPTEKPTHVMIWRHPTSGEWRYRDAEDVDLLALKLIVDQIDPRTAASLGKVTIGNIQSAIDRALDHGFLIGPESRIQRDRQPGRWADPSLGPYAAADLFTLQWHITQTCDLHCKHCYDRSDRAPLALDTAMGILDDFYSFCRRMHVRGQVSFTGGNPLLYPYFDTVYRAAAQFGFGIAILGNPTAAARIASLLEIARPLYFQISLEGLATHNDAIRGKGHFERSLAFLQDLRTLDIFSMVMLTLTRDNLDQVLPLADLLKRRADYFTFNRLSTVGEGANLRMPGKKAFEDFLKAYVRAAAGNPIMGLKDNLFNLIRWAEGTPPFGGCTGYGCGAAFNFMALLPDGEVHACRKFPSPLGNIQDTSLYDIYHTDLAARYRAGSQACRNCRLNPVCRGCLAITHSAGLEVFADKDPFCFAPSALELV